MRQMTSPFDPVEPMVRGQTLFELFPAFDGETIDDALDTNRLRRQLDQVRTLLLSEYRWHTLAEIRTKTGIPEASASARLRDLRKEKFGGYTIERQRRSAGTFEYRMARPCVVQNW
jgi:biotin operon repressor